MLKKIEWLKTYHEAGSASLRLVIGDKIIYFDPAFLTSLPEKGDADIICISHWHDDHCDKNSFIKLMNEKTVIITNSSVASRITKYVNEPQLCCLEPGDDLPYEKLSIKAVASYEEESGVHNKEFGFTGFVVSSSDEGTLYYSGDSGITEELDQLTNTIDMAVLCVRAHEPTLFLNYMGDFVSRVKPGVLIPVHWRPEDKKIIEDKLSEVCNDVEVRLLEQSEIES